jgi:hypothetical protein
MTKALTMERHDDQWWYRVSDVDALLEEKESEISLLKSNLDNANEQWRIALEVRDELEEETKILKAQLSE